MSPKMKLQYCIYIILIISRNNAYAESDETTNEPVTYRITDKLIKCSGWLAALISKVCDNVYKIVKRDTSLFIEKLQPKRIQELRKKQRLIAEERWRRVRRQIASECCDKPCTMGNIMMYCPEDAKLLREHPDLFEN